MQFGRDYCLLKIKDSDALTQQAKDLGEILLQGIETGSMAELSEVAYLKDDGSYSDFQEGSAGGRVFGLIVLILISAGFLYVGGRWVYRRHQEKRYAHRPLDQVEYLTRIQSFALIGNRICRQKGRNVPYRSSLLV